MTARRLRRSADERPKSPPQMLGNTPISSAVMQWTSPHLELLWFSPELPSRYSTARSAAGRVSE